MLACLEFVSADIDPNALIVKYSDDAANHLKRQKPPRNAFPAKG
jgi:hypothetical protein